MVENETPQSRIWSILSGFHVGFFEWLSYTEKWIALIVTLPTCFFVYLVSWVFEFTQFSQFAKFCSGDTASSNWVYEFVNFSIA